MDKQKLEQLIAKITTGTSKSAAAVAQRAVWSNQRRLIETLDHILLTEWDPIGIGDIEGMEDEYHSYLPKIVALVVNGAPIRRIVRALMTVERDLWGDDRGRRRCQVIAAMVAQYGPLGQQQPFTPVIDTRNSRAAYRSVVDLVTRTRIDAYEQRWDAVCTGYQQVLAICQTHLPRRKALRAACQHNLAMSCSLTGAYQQAIGHYTAALRALEAQAQDEYWYVLVCLENMVNLVQHLGRASEADPYLSKIAKINARIAKAEPYGELDLPTLEQAASADPSVRPALHPTWLPVERDSRAGYRCVLEIE